MEKLANYQTLLQLGIGLNLVIGAYSSHRKNVEDRIKDSLDQYREQMDEILASTLEPVKAIDYDLQDRPVKLLNDRELSRYLSDCTIRFYQRRERFMRRDGYVEPLLYPIGFLSLSLLVYASLWPKTEVSYGLAYPICAVMLGPPIFALVRLLLETRNHERFYRGRASKTYREKVSVRHEERLRTSLSKGEIVRVTNAVRLRHSALQTSRRKTSYSDQS